MFFIAFHRNCPNAVVFSSATVGFLSKNISEPVCVPRQSTRDPATPGLRAGTFGKSGAIKLGTESWSESFAKSLRSHSQTDFRNSVRPLLTVPERPLCAGPGSSSVVPHQQQQHPWELGTPLLPQASRSTASGSRAQQGMGILMPL